MRKTTVLIIFAVLGMFIQSCASTNTGIGGRSEADMRRLTEIDDKAEPEISTMQYSPKVGWHYFINDDNDLNNVLNIIRHQVKRNTNFRLEVNEESWIAKNFNAFYVQNAFIHDYRVRRCLLFLNGYTMELMLSDKDFEELTQPYTKEKADIIFNIVVDMVNKMISSNF